MGLSVVFLNDVIFYLVLLFIGLCGKRKKAFDRKSIEKRAMARLGKHEE